MVVVDYFSKWLEVVPITHQETTTTTVPLLGNVVAWYGILLFWSRTQLRVRTLLTSHGFVVIKGDHTQNDEIAETNNWNITSYLPHTVSENERYWGKLLQNFLTWIYWLDSSNGREMKLLSDLMFGSPSFTDWKWTSSYWICKRPEEQITKSLWFCSKQDSNC